MGEVKQIKYELKITAEKIESTDTRFTMDDLTFGDYFKPIDAYFQDANGTIVRRNRYKGENRISNQTLPRLACQIFEKNIEELNPTEKNEFPICRYSPSKDLICGIFTTEAEYLKHGTDMQKAVYKRDGGPQFFFYSWNVFSTLLMIQECLKRFGKEGDEFVFVYRDKTEQELNKNSSKKALEEDIIQTSQESMNVFSKMLLESKNIIFRGAPGTGKSYLAKEIAADIISNGYTDQYENLTTEQKKQVEFVQFHPNYDYSDFVEGLRPKLNPDGSMGFELQDGVFKKFVNKARVNFENSLKSSEELKKYIFIIDEINRGEISKILGELFFAIDPGYRGKVGEVTTQYANMHADLEEKFYIPENVYIIGTMNDIDRSIDTFDFAMRRRFRFIEIKAESTQDMLECLEDEKLKNKSIEIMDKLNAEIIKVDGLNENYQIGAAYFLKVKTLGFNALWEDYLCPLLQEYVRGLYDENGIMNKFASAYGYPHENEGVVIETVEN